MISTYILISSRYLTTTGGVFPASSSYFGDLFAETLPTPGAVLPRALELAIQIASQTSPISTYLMREMMYRGPNSAEGAHLLDSELMVQLYDKEDKAEGISSFVEKRPVKFKGDFKTGVPQAVPWWEPLNIVPARMAARTGSSKL